MKTYEYNKIVNVSTFMWEVQKSSIKYCLSDINVVGNTSYITFKEELSTEDEVTLTELVNNHNASIIAGGDDVSEVSVVEIPKYALQEIDRTYIERSIVIPTDTTVGPHTTSFQFRYPVVLLGGDLYLTPDMIGDEVKVIIHFAPDDIVGALPEPAVTGNDYIMVNSEAVLSGYIWKSYELTMVRSDGSEYFIGECIRVEGNKVILDRALTEDLTAGLYVKCVAAPVPYLKVTSSVGSIRIGDGTTRGAYMPKDSVMECIYTNNSLKEKDVGYMIEYYV
jgi:hypothetical protein